MRYLIVIVCFLLFSAPIYAQDINKSDIIFYKKITECIQYDYDNDICLNNNTHYLYKYKTPYIVKEKGKIINNNTVKLNNSSYNKNSFKIYSGQQFYLDNNEWKYIEYATSTINDFEKIIQTFSWFDLIINIANAQVTYYPETSDGYLSRLTVDQTFDNIHDGAGTNVANGGVYIQARLTSSNGNPNWRNLDRGHYNFNTTAIDDDAIIDSVVLKVVCNNEKVDAGDLSYNWYSFNPASSTNPVTGDFLHTNYGSTALSTDFDAGDTTIGTRISFTFNDTGKNEINKTGFTDIALRSTNDADDSAPAWPGAVLSSLMRFYTMEQAGTTSDPYMVITTSDPPSDATSTLMNEMVSSDDLSIFTSKKWHFGTSGSAFAYTVDYYHVPFFVWLVFAIPTILIGTRLTLELIIRWRKI